MSAGVERSPPYGISVLVSGVGVGGLFSGLECWRRGCEVRILEKKRRFIHNRPNSDQRLQRLARDASAGGKIAYKPLLSHYNQRGELLKGRIDLAAMVSDSMDPAGIPKIYRHSPPKFHAMLLEQLAKIGLKVEYGSEVVDYYEDAKRGRAGVVLADGSKQDADLVIAADSVRWNSWPLVMGHPVPVKSSGSAIFRVAYPVDVALTDPIVAERFRLQDDGRSVIEMPEIGAVFWRNEDEMSLAITHPDHGTADESWGHRIHPDEALKLTTTIPGWPEYADRVIKTPPADQLIDWKLMWRDPQKKWTSPSGHVVQLGDAAHTFLPSSGNGGTQAMEDAISLATCLPIAGKDSIPQATRVHNLWRFERVSCLQAFGLVNRNARDTKKHDIKEKKFEMKVARWILDHDPEQYAVDNYEQALAHLMHDAPFKNTNTPPDMVYVPWTIDGLLESEGERRVNSLGRQLELNEELQLALISVLVCAPLNNWAGLAECLDDYTQ